MYICLLKVSQDSNNIVCQDLDECKLTTPVCSTNQDCANTDGGYTCSCKAGYTTLNNSLCVLDTTTTTSTTSTSTTSITTTTALAPFASGISQAGLILAIALPILAVVIIIALILFSYSRLKM